MGVVLKVPTRAPMGTMCVCLRVCMCAKPKIYERWGGTTAAAAA